MGYDAARRNVPTERVMTMPFSNTAKNTMLDGLPALFASLHTADPGVSGASEMTGGSPAYARQAAAFDAASTGSAQLTADETFDVPASTVTHGGYFDALSGGNFIGGFDLVDEVFAAQGQYKLLAASSSLDIT